jgi:hypothetical protein
MLAAQASGLESRFIEVQSRECRYAKTPNRAATPAQPYFSRPRSTHVRRIPDTEHEVI